MNLHILMTQISSHRVVNSMTAGNISTQSVP